MVSKYYFYAVYCQVMNTVTIFTDGASRGNPGPGGWGAVIFVSQKTSSSQQKPVGVVKELGGGEAKTTNNRMEMSAVIGALEYVHAQGVKKVHVLTDSSYVMKGATLWIRGWKQSSWQTKAKTDVANKDLWQKMDELLVKVNIGWKLLPGHSGIPGNERADEIATAFADGGKPKLYEGSYENYDRDLMSLEAVTVKKRTSSGKAYSYLSLVDKEIVRHKDWKSCEARVKGKQAQYRKALSPEEEKEIVEKWGYTLDDVRDQPFTT